MTKGIKQFFTIGARGSRLSLAQANWVLDKLTEAHLDKQFQLKVIKTGGDTDQKTPLTEIGGTGVFVKELERALRRGEIDFAVHSAKDLPAELEDEFKLSAVPQRASVEDALVSRNGVMLRNLPAGAKVATGSPRRRAQMRRIRWDLVLVDVRGNVDTRLRKLDEGQFDAIILARAGLERLGLGDYISEVLSIDSFLPTPGQGFLAVETLRDNSEATSVAANISSDELGAALAAERALLKGLQAGCSIPVGGWARWIDNKLIMDAVVLSLDGSREIRASMECSSISEASELGRKVAEKLIQKGAREILNHE